MDLDLKEGWEKKALIVIAVVVVIIVLYAFNPFQPKPNITTYNETPSQNTAPIPFEQTVTTDSNNSTNNTGNITTQISADQAKSIAEQAFPGYKAGDPMQGTVVLNSTTIAVWIVPLKSSTSSKTAYVDITTGRIVKES